MSVKTKTRGRRAAPSTDHTAGPREKITLGGSSAKVAQTVEDGFYDLRVTDKPRTVVSKKRATSVILPVALVDGTPIKVRPLLVQSPGGDSDLVFAGRALLERLLGLDDAVEMDLDEALTKLAGIEFHAELQETVDHRDQPVMDVLEVVEVYDSTPTDNTTED